MSRFQATLFSSIVFLAYKVNDIVALSSNLSPTSLPRSHVSSRVCNDGCASFPSPMSRSHRALMMNAGGNKRRKRKSGPKTSQIPGGSSVSNATGSELSIDAGTGAGDAAGGTPALPSARELEEVLEGERGLEELFTDDWSDMPANEGMVKSKVPLPDISTFKPSNRATTSMERRQTKTAGGKVAKEDDSNGDAVPGSLSGFKSKLPPIVDREEERLALSAAERFDEGPIVKGLKTATWFSICALVAWEVYINSPFFQSPAPPPIT